MSIYAISDLHLSFGTNKPMNIFKGWDNHTERIKANWKRLVKEEDTVILPGDFSWGLKLEETVKDFEFLEKLPGKKLLLKGNHDLWWSTAKKLHEFFYENEFNSVDIIYNNCAVCENRAIAGTRGWFFDDTADKKVLLREAGRLEASISQAEKTGLPTEVFLHYPPVYGDEVCSEIFDIIKKHGIKKVYHGHIHGLGFNKAVSEYEGVKFKLISCDCIDFTPVLVV
ncbi:MAG: metallophosphoesterase [Acutalibacteraceae bacterium]|nr:metallophosphoesterase [Acutalibacteraceae bacterium]